MNVRSDVVELRCRRAGDLNDQLVGVLNHLRRIRILLIRPVRGDECALTFDDLLSEELDVLGWDLATRTLDALRDPIFRPPHRCGDLANRGSGATKIENLVRILGLLDAAGTRFLKSHVKPSFCRPTHPASAMRSSATATYFGSSSMAWQRREVVSHATKVVPDPLNGS